MNTISSRIGCALPAILLLALSACGTHATRATAPIPASPRPTTPAPPTPTARPWILLPSPTTTASPTPTVVPNASIPELKSAALQEQIDQLARRFLGQGTNSGLGVAVVLRDPATGELQAMMLSYGKTSKVDGQPVTPDTEYEIGSITKAFTGILLAQQVRAGAMGLDDPLQNYLPQGVEAPTYNNIPITVDDLVTHRSGLPRDIDTNSRAGLHAWLNSYTLTRAPGAEYVYSNVGYGLIGDILTQKAGTDFHTLEYESVSRPLGLLDTIEQLDAGQRSRLAQGYTYDGSPTDYMPDSGVLSSAGYLRSTLQDMTRFLVENMQPDSTPLADSIELAQVSQGEGPNPGTGTGLGWDIDKVGTANERIYKGGTTYGFTSYISFLRNGSSGFVLLTNGMYADTLVPRMLKIVSSARQSP